MDIENLQVAVCSAEEFGRALVPKFQRLLVGDESVAGAHHAEMLAGFRVDDCAMGIEDDGAILLIKKMQGAQLHGKKNLAEVGAPWAVGRDGGGGTMGREQGRVHADTMKPMVGQMRS